MVSSVAGSAKSLVSERASKAAVTAWRNDSWKGTSSFAQREFPISKRTWGSSVVSRCVRSRNPSLISCCGSWGKPSAARISSKVSPSAPFRVMASAIDAPRGDRRMFGRSSRVATSRTRSKPNAVELPMTCCSATDSARGSSVMDSNSGPTTWLHAATSTTAGRTTEALVLRRPTAEPDDEVTWPDGSGGCSRRTIACA